MIETIGSLKMERDEARDALRRTVEWLTEWRIAREAEVFFDPADQDI